MPSSFGMRFVCKVAMEEEFTFEFTVVYMHVVGDLCLVHARTRMIVCILTRNMSDALGFIAPIIPPAAERSMARKTICRPLP